MAAGISDAGAAKALVEAVRYARYADFEKKLVIAIIESPRGIDALPQLLAVDGVDAWFVGPNDLAHRMGFPGGGQREEVRRTVTAALRKIASSGKTAGTVCRPDEIASFLETGGRLVMTRVNDLLARGAAEFRDRLPASRN
jgi:4-hydroxy-2-oxoheptanedioate aldolase